MKNFIKWVKMDFDRVSSALCLRRNKDISKGMCILWYLAWMPLTIWFIPVTYYLETKYVPRKIKSWIEDEA